MKRIKPVFYGCLFIYVFFPLLTCSHPLINPVDPQAENYQGYRTVSTVDAVTGDYPVEGEIFTWCEFRVSNVLDSAADLYGVQITYSLEGFDLPWYEDITSTDNIFDASMAQLTEGNLYYRAAARESGGAWGKWSDAVPCIADSGVDEASISPPSGFSTPNTVDTLLWNHVDGAVSFEVEYGTSLSALDGIGVISVISALYHINTLFSVGDTCYWRVRAVNEDGVAGVWSRVFTYEIRAPEIGETFAGGLVFHLDGSGGGLVCATQDQSTGAQWGGYGTTVGGTYESVGTGEANTTKIVDDLGNNGGTPYAAKLCSELVLNGHTDWFLPSRDELNLMYENLGLQDLGEFGWGYYWTSSEQLSEYAWVRNFSESSTTYKKKNTNLRVRAVRAFSY